MTNLKEMVARWRSLSTDPNSGLDECYSLALGICADELEAALPVQNETPVDAGARGSEASIAGVVDSADVANPASDNG